MSEKKIGHAYVIGLNLLAIAAVIVLYFASNTAFLAMVRLQIIPKENMKGGSFVKLLFKSNGLATVN